MHVLLLGCEGAGMLGRDQSIAPPLPHWGLMSGCVVCFHCCLEPSLNQNWPRALDESSPSIRCVGETSVPAGSHR